MPLVETTGLMSDEAADSVILSQSKRQKIFAYLGILIVLLAFGAPSGGLIDIPISFLLKNKLHLQASELANFRLVAALPLYSSCIFGFVCDTWNPIGMGDRGFCYYSVRSARYFILSLPSRPLLMRRYSSPCFC
jgi:hypothetical protein